MTFEENTSNTWLRFRELEKLAARAEYDAKLIKELKDNIEDAKRREAERLHEENEVKKWEMLNRYKQDEVVKAYDQNKAEQHWQKILKYREDLNAQMNDIAATKNREVAQEKEEVEFLKRREEEMNKEFFEYAKEVRDLATSKGRNPYAIDKVIYVRSNFCSDGFVREIPRKNSNILL